MSSAIESTLRRLDYVLGDLPWVRAHLDCFITDFIHQFEVGQPEEVAYRVEHEGDGEFDGDDGEVYLSWDDIELELWMDPWGLLQAQYPESLDPIMEGYIGEQLLAAHERRVVDGVAVDLDSEEYRQAVLDELGDGGVVDGFGSWVDYFDEVEQFSENMVQCQVAMEWVEKVRGVGEQPNDRGWLVAGDRDFLMVGCEGCGAVITASGEVREVYKAP